MTQAMQKSTNKKIGKSQYSKFGEKGNDGLLQELNQLHERQALLPMKEEDMTYKE